MLSGEKHLAVFYDVVRESFHNNDDIIPESDFTPYVQNGSLIRHQKDFFHARQNQTVRYVCFTTPGNEWRAQAFYHAHEEGISGKRPFDDAYEYLVGRLLGYNEQDIKDFISKLALNRAIRT